MTATPDSLSRDGGSQAAVAVTVRDAAGRAVSGVSIRLEMQVDGYTQDFGALSARTIVTGADGRATAVYTAPAPPPPGVSASVQLLSLVATPFGSNAQAERSHTVSIRIVPPGVFLPPAPTPRFTYSPNPPTAHAPVQFDGGSSCGAPVGPAAPCPASSPAIISYVWDFGDGDTATGRVVSHAFSAEQTFGVTLTVTTEGGSAASTTTPVPVAAGAEPTADFAVSPTNPTTGQTINFNAALSRAGAGHRIVEYRWSFGDGATATGGSASHVYALRGTYTVTLTVVDEAGQTATTTKTVPVA
jgi:chitodextrinase